MSLLCIFKRINFFVFKMLKCHCFKIVVYNQSHYLLYNNYVINGPLVCLEANQRFINLVRIQLTYHITHQTETSKRCLLTPPFTCLRTQRERSYLALRNIKLLNKLVPTQASSLYENDMETIITSEVDNCQNIRFVFSWN